MVELSRMSLTPERSTEMSATNPQLLDCTIRDGGYVLGWDQSPKYVRELVNMCGSSKIDYCEIGFINGRRQDSGWWDALTAEIVQSIIPHGMTPRPELVAMLDYGTNTVEGLKWLEQSPISIIRIAVRIEDLHPAMEFATRLTSTTGVKCCINVMQLSTLLDSDLRSIYSLTKEYKPWGLYLADSFGACLPKKVYEDLVFLAGLDDTHIGFHGHNNLQLALANSLAAVEAGATLIDCTVTGVGRGGGNLPTELAVGHWIGSYESSKVVEFYESYLKEYLIVGTSHKSLATALMNCHPNYGTLNVANSYGNFLHLLGQLPDADKRRFLRHAFDYHDED